MRTGTARDASTTIRRKILGRRTFRRGASMIWHERLICASCIPKLKTAEMTWQRVPGKDDVAVCAFCGIYDRRVRPCKCFRIATQKNR